MTWEVISIPMHPQAVPLTIMPGQHAVSEALV